MSDSKEMTPFERAARAVETTIFNPALKADISIICDDPSRVHRAIARAVLRAIREPNEGMMARGANEIPFDDEHGVDRELRAVGVWQAMIDAALEEG